MLLEPVRISLRHLNRLNGALCFISSNDTSKTYYSSSVLACPSFPWSVYVSFAGQSVLYTT